MRRPPGLWILLSAGVLWLSLQDVYGIRATALIFGKSSTSTTTEAVTTASTEETIKSEGSNTTEVQTKSNSTDGTNSTSPILTGNPQIDYIWDPNLPKELNGYNLSEYPFYERVPEVLDFKCDGLHDGFYASVLHKCQVYHHCLFGTRFDFLCANYTAFDQKTFICQFVSEVDCVNSKKFWHRNDALYQAQSTTTSAPVNLKAAIYTTAPPNGGDPITPQGRPTRRPGGGFRRRPGGRRRPPVEYYDDDYYDDEYYDERPRARPRPRPRPVYDDDYDEYEDQRYEARRGNGRKRPYKRRNQERRKPQNDDNEEVDDRFEDEDFVAAPKRSKTNDRRKRPIADSDEEEEDTRSRKRGNDRNPSRKKSGNRQPVEEYEEDDIPEPEDSRNNEQRPRKRPKENKEDNANSNDGRPIIKPSTGTIYDRPRVAPKINLPVPKNAADKYAYKGVNNGGTSRTTTTETPLEEEEYAEEEIEPARPSKGRRKPASGSRQENNESKSQPSDSRPRKRKPDSEETIDKTTSRPKHAVLRNNFRPSSALKKKPPVSQEYEDEEYLDEEKEVAEQSVSENTKKASSTTTSTSTTTSPPQPPRREPSMRVIKRPFLPSRGGSPYSSRGLQPVGLKAVDKSIPENDSQESRNGEQIDSSKEVEEDYLEEEPETDVSNTEELQNVRKPAFKPSPVLVKSPTRPQYTAPSAEAQELIESEPSRQQSYKTKEFVGPRTTQRPKIADKNPLDLNEYDVTLNDALNPTLPNLPVRAFPTGFSSGNDYGYTNAYSRPRYVLEPIISPSTQNFVSPNKRSQQRYEAVPQTQYTTVTRGYRQQQPQHAQTQAIYSGY
ncbi:probable serine/threonine-protein kinase kinX [Dendroctonus ponderosae]|uniref:probable serine/threonine-protein kinase kinX n=1 Tax=Dendroctonus ponderosae TaxID=77166 RepID=UPI002035ABD7|nr:probable serine/threonine-protein kinase kinX [Dendroctonus ponderosae]XP_048523321.1 probable serine/threonine-protein kinase kinX [Dendroctonus ponderosae]